MNVSNVCKNSQNFENENISDTFNSISHVEKQVEMSHTSKNEETVVADFNQQNIMEAGTLCKNGEILTTINTNESHAPFLIDNSVQELPANEMQIDESIQSEKWQESPDYDLTQISDHGSCALLHQLIFNLEAVVSRVQQRLGQTRLIDIGDLQEEVEDNHHGSIASQINRERIRELEFERDKLNMEMQMLMQKMGSTNVPEMCPISNQVHADVSNFVNHFKTVENENIVINEQNNKNIVINEQNNNEEINDDVPKTINMETDAKSELQSEHQLIKLDSVASNVAITLSEISKSINVETDNLLEKSNECNIPPVFAEQGHLSSKNEVVAEQLPSVAVNDTLHQDHQQLDLIVNADAIDTIILTNDIKSSEIKLPCNDAAIVTAIDEKQSAFGAGNAINIFQELLVNGDNDAKQFVTAAIPLSHPTEGAVIKISHQTSYNSSNAANAYLESTLSPLLSIDHADAKYVSMKNLDCNVPATISQQTASNERNSIENKDKDLTEKNTSFSSSTFHENSSVQSFLSSKEESLHRSQSQKLLVDRQPRNVLDESMFHKYAASVTITPGMCGEQLSVLIAACESSSSENFATLASCKNHVDSSMHVGLVQTRENAFSNASAKNLLSHHLQYYGNHSLHTNLSDISTNAHRDVYSTCNVLSRVLNASQIKRNEIINKMARLNILTKPKANI
jgi:hypothetical protein